MNASDPQEPRTIYEDDAVKVSRLGSGGERLVLCITGVGMGNVPVQREEFIGTSMRGGSSTGLYLFDKKRSWFNGAGVVERLVEVTRQELSAGNFGRVIAVGNSMGGFGAILLTSFLPIDVSVAISPQFTIDRSLMPYERRWRSHIDEIDEIRYRDLSSHFRDETSYFVLHGQKGEDWRHVRLFPVKHNLRHLVIRGSGHNIAKYLKDRDLLGPIVSAMMDCNDEDLSALTDGLTVPPHGFPQTPSGWMHRVLPDGPWFR